MKLRDKCLKIAEEFPDLATSNFFISYLPVLLGPMGIISIFDEKMDKIAQ